MTEPSLNDLLEAFKTSLKAIDTYDQPSDAPDSSTLERFLAPAAFCGPFDLHRFVSFAPNSIQAMLTLELIKRTESQTVNGRLRRLLLITARRRILAEALSQPALFDELLTAIPLAREDTQGRMLRSLIKGWRPDLSKLSDERIGTLSIALGWLQGLEPPQNAHGQGTTPWPQISQVQQEQARRARKTEIKNLLSGGMVGRESELRSLLTFVDSTDTANDIMIITGPGGVGKSTLAARLANTLSARKPSTPVFNFDLDRPSLNPVGPGLTLELTRQLARYLPGSEDALAEIRTLTRETFERSGGQSEHKQSDEASSVSTSSESALLIAQEIVGTGFTHHPVVVFMDSFEAAAAQGEKAVTALREWLAILRYEMGMRGVRIFIIGRAAESAAKLLYVDEPNIYHLGPLNPADAVQLLMRSGLDNKRSNEVVGALGGNPLVLRLMSRYLQENLEVSGEALLEDSDVNEALSQGVLYRRILNRVGNGSNDPLRKLAYPGLALRVITPGLLREVLAPIVLQDSNYDVTENTALFDRLAQQIWLVDKESARCVRHRRDLREITLRLLRNDPAMAVLVKELHVKAIEYYTHTKDDDLPDGRAKLELVYHRLMLLAPNEDLPVAEHDLVRVALAGEFDELSPHAAALARFHSGMRTTAEDLKLLPVSYRRKATAEVAWAAIDTGRPDDALKLYQPSQPVSVWYLTALHDAVQWRSTQCSYALREITKTNNEQDTQRRESIEESMAVSAFLHLWRGEREAIISPADEAFRRKRVSRSGTSPYRAAAAWGISALLQGNIHHPGWLAMREMLSPKYRTPRDALIAKAEARLWLLLWSAGHLDPDEQIPILADSLAPGPELSKKIAQLWNGSYKSSLSPTVHSLLKFRSDDPFAVLTGKYARTIEGVIRKDEVNLRSNLEAAGFGPQDFLPGLMTELQPATRRLLYAVIAQEESRKDLIQYMNDYIKFSVSDFVPYDIRPGRWLKAASEGNGMRATLALIDWCGRVGKTSNLCRAAAHLADPVLMQPLQDLASAWRLLETAGRQKAYRP